MSLESSRALLTTAIASTIALLVAYLALGGAGYKPMEIANPCDPRPADDRDLLEQIALSALDGAACALQVPREELALALADSEGLAEFASSYGLTDEEVQETLRAGLERAVADAESAGRISSLEAALLGQAVAALPIGVAISALQTPTGQSVLEFAQGLLSG